MPIINIKTTESEKKLELHVIVDEIAEETGIDASRIQMIADYYPKNDFLTSDVFAFIHISAAEKNGKEMIQALMKASASAVAKQLEVEQNRVVAFAHPINTGYLFIRNQFI